ncbi:glycoside hydrolase family 13 protein [Cellulosilyticum lentocellum]|uniref:Alpha-amylase n=1 Tax=Cellulosilyticum lentocellum (strain ATCC 49066 / DSM 5427 / NCIMB 11756 / RHM5) TaxID=642492 RepID=F2JPE9_CELLD|nr:alpha-glucosidase [Cellulosilyticum lentocellum]ADZ82497.1 Oligo-1,6-glucosidase [Cellulosilyticum lentocellum DSM 5427]
MNWRKEAVGYQIYPRSFMDSNGDGIGDLQGIISKLDYIKDLGIDVIWICPMYESPNDDNGYDISNYQGIMKEFGTMADFDELLRKVHEKGMKLIIDLVLNHTSDEHPWFLESRASKESNKRDWYIWREGKEGKEPNNWESIFHGSAWEYDEATDEYFLHLFSRKQPDLNWENKEVRHALYAMVNWWLDKGIDGFRIDAISHIKKEPGLLDMPNPEGLQYVSSFDKHMNIEGIHDFLEELNKETFSKYDIMTVGEANGVNAEEAKLWVGEKNGKFDMVFQFEHLDLWDTEGEQKLDVLALKKVLSRWQNSLYKEGWNALFIENHDIVRVVSKWGDDEKYWAESSKALAMMYFMQQGTPFIYQGQEIGMTNVHYPEIFYYNDIATYNRYIKNREEGMLKEVALKHEWAASRDNARTPMQWDGSEKGGFTTGEPWLAINPNVKAINVANQLEDSQSILNFYKDLIRIRKANSTFIEGKYELVMPEDTQLYAYTRTDDHGKFLIICNLTGEEAQFTADFDLEDRELLLSNYEIQQEHQLEVIRPYEARLYCLS